jgi:hypothetical protein
MVARQCGGAKDGKSGHKRCEKDPMHGSVGSARCIIFFAP